MSGAAEYRAVQKGGPEGPWIIVYSSPVRGFEGASVDAESYPSREAAEARIAAMAARNGGK